MIEMITSPEYIKMYEIAEQIIKNDYIVMDDATGGITKNKPVGVALTEAGQIGLVLDSTTTYPLNPVYISKFDSKVHVSGRCVGPSIDGYLDIIEHNRKSASNIACRISDVLYLDHISRLVRK